MFSNIKLAIFCLVVGCSNSKTEAPKDHDEKFRRTFGSLLGDDTLVFSTAPKKSSLEIVKSSSINPYIWKASLDVLNFMPLASSDAIGGVIVTDWYSLPNKPFEKIKVTVYITGKELRSESLKVSIYKRVKNIDKDVEKSVIADLHCLILSKAKELYLASKR